MKRTTNKHLDWAVEQCNELLDGIKLTWTASNGRKHILQESTDGKSVKREIASGSAGELADRLMFLYDVLFAQHADKQERD